MSTLAAYTSPVSIAIVDYGMANLRSVQKAFEEVGHKADIISTPQQTCAELDSSTSKVIGSPTRGATLSVRTVMLTPSETPAHDVAPGE